MDLSQLIMFNKWTEKKWAILKNTFLILTINFNVMKKFYFPNDLLNGFSETSKRRQSTAYCPECHTTTNRTKISKISSIKICEITVQFEKVIGKS